MASPLLIAIGFPARQLNFFHPILQFRHRRPIYQHIITGVKSTIPHDFLGGILGDDMGLGKSLTMLSAIVSSSGEANKYASEGASTHLQVEHRRTAKSTLIVVPSACKDKIHANFASTEDIIVLLDNWIEEINKHVIRGAVRYYKYHGLGRAKDPSELAQYDIIVTTYGTVVADCSRSLNMLPVLEALKWYRIIIDEAHVIRNLSTKQFQAVNRIQAHIRWCLTGTPIQNTLSDLGALVTFLGVPILQDPPIFRKHINDAAHLSKSQSSFKNLRTLLGSICLRRPKTILSLFGLNEKDRRLQFSDQEQSEYKRLLEQGRRAIDLVVSSHNTKESHQSMIEAILRLRLFCNNGSRQGPDGHSSFLEDPAESLSLLEQSGEAFCEYCKCPILSVGILDSPDFVHLTRCRRLVCGDCQSQYHAQSNSRSSCGLCLESHGMDNMFLTRTQVPPKKATARSIYPSKLMALLEDVRKNPLHEKSIVFSFWKTSLDLIAELFGINGIRFCRVDGSLSLGKRKAVLSKFQKNPEVGVLIMTLGTGAVGLNNLSIASRIYLLEPQWNPSVERQAIGRVFRLGQERPVTVIRYMMEKTIEVSVKDKQQRKLNLARGGFDARNCTQPQRLRELLQDF